LVKRQAECENKKNELDRARGALKQRRERWAVAKESVRGEVETLCAESEAQVKSDIGAIKNNLPSFRGDAYVEWKELAEASHKDFVNEIRSLTVDCLLEGAQSGVKYVGSLSPKKADKLISDLDRLGADNQHLKEAIKKIGLVPGRRVTGDQVALLVKAIQYDFKLWKAVKNPDRLEGFASATSLLVNNPAAKHLLGWGELALSILNLSHAAGGVQVARDNILLLNQLTEDQLQNLAMLERRLKRDVRLRNECDRLKSEITK